MTDDEINLAIAKQCGWWMQHGVWIEPCGENKRVPPHYCSDLNGMHEAELSLTKHERSDYTCILHELACVPGDLGFGETTASAKHRAQAFLTVKGLWKE